jgi:hypothetical protein
MKDVLVLDLRPLRRQPDKAREFVIDRAGEFRLAGTEPEEIRSRIRPAEELSGISKSARRLGVERGCNLVLVLRTGPYFGRQRNPQARIRMRRYAFVVMGERMQEISRHID